MQDNLEFCQWIKKFWDGAEHPGGYDAEARSYVGPLCSSFVLLLVGQWVVKYLIIRPERTLTLRGGLQTRGGSAAGTGAAPAAANRRAPTTAARTASRTNPVSVGAGRTVSSAQVNAAHAAQLADLTAQVEHMSVENQDMDRERSFYFDSAFSVLP